MFFEISRWAIGTFVFVLAFNPTALQDEGMKINNKSETMSDGSQAGNLSKHWECCISSALYGNTDIPDKAKILYLVIKQLCFAGPKGYCFASNATLGRYVGCTGDYIKKLLRVLRNEGWVTVTLDGISDRKIYARNDNRQKAKKLEAIDCDFDKRPDANDENGEQFGDNTDETDTDPKSQNEGDDAGSKAQTRIVTAGKGSGTQQALIPQTCDRTAMEVFELTLWKNDEVADIIAERGGSKKVAFERWCKITKRGKDNALCDLLRTRYREMADAQKRAGLSWNSLEVFLNPSAERWLTDWSKVNTRPMTSTQAKAYVPNGVTVLSRTTQRTVSQANFTAQTQQAEFKQASETVTETARVLGGDGLHLRDDYQKGSVPKHWVTIACNKKLYDLNLSETLKDSWRKVTNWQFAPKELKQAVAELYDEGWRYNINFERVLPIDFEAKLEQTIIENAEVIGKKIGDPNSDIDHYLIRMAEDDFDRKFNYTTEYTGNNLYPIYRDDGTKLYHKLDADNKNPPSEWREGKFPFAEYIRKRARYFIKNRNENDAVRYIVNYAVHTLEKPPLRLSGTSSTEALPTVTTRNALPCSFASVVQSACKPEEPTRMLPTEQKENPGLFDNVQPVKPVEPVKNYPLGDNFQDNTQPKYWFRFLKKFANGWETKKGMIDDVENLTTWENFPRELLSFLRMAFRTSKGGLSCIGMWTEFRGKNLYAMADELTAS